MNLGAVKDALRVLSHPAGTNPVGNCTVCAVLSAEALVEGVAPQGLAPDEAWTISQEASQRGKHELFQISPDHMRPDEDTRAYMVWRWLRQEAPLGVYLFEQDEDHVYNFVKDGTAIYLIDSACQVYRKVNTAGDCSVISPCYQPDFETMDVGGVTPNTQYGFNYISPQPLDDDDDLHVYQWGPLHVNWQ